jgi:hypothetical protein
VEIRAKKSIDRNKANAERREIEAANLAAKRMATNTIHGNALRDSLIAWANDGAYDIFLISI